MLRLLLCSMVVCLSCAQGRGTEGLERGTKEGTDTQLSPSSSLAPTEVSTARGPSTLPAIEPEDHRIDLLDAGNSPRRRLRYQATVGQRVQLHSRGTVGLKLTAFGQPLFDNKGTNSLDLTVTVTDVEAKGIRLGWVVDRLEFSGPMPGMPKVVESHLVGDVLVSDQGEILELNLPFLEEREFIRPMIDPVHLIIRFPQEPVGIGASWQSDNIRRDSGICQRLMARYQLISLNEKEGRVHVTYEIETFNQLIDGFLGAGSLMDVKHGMGTFENEILFSRSEPARVSFQYTGQLGFDMVMRRGRGKRPVTMNVAMGQSVTSR